MKCTSTSAGNCRGKVLMEVFGCQMNRVDAELVLGGFRRLRFASTDNYDDADVVVFNTCSVREHAEQRVFSRLGALRAWKAGREGRVLAVMGCMAQREAVAIRRRMPHVDLVAGTRDFPAIADAVIRLRGGSGPLILTDGQARPDMPRNPAVRPRAHQAFVSVMRGCNRPCTYCVVPSARGRATSRPVDEVCDEVRALVDDGVVEICLLGQTVNAYDGSRRGEVTLGTLLRKLDQVAGLRRLRFITSHPQEFNEDTLAAMTESSRLDRFLHMPVQSGSDRMLKTMKRGYTVGKYLAMVDRIRELIPDMEIGCDWIVGFPGETEQDHQASLRLCAQVGFSKSFVFKYSPRPHTAAAAMENDLPDEVKKRRNQDLLALQLEISLRNHRALVGCTLEVLIDGRSRLDATRWSGRDRAHRIVILEEQDLRPGLFVSARVTRCTALTLFGTVCQPVGCTS